MVSISWVAEGVQKYGPSRIVLPWPPQVHHNEMQPTYFVIVGDIVL